MRDMIDAPWRASGAEIPGRTRASVAGAIMTRHFDQRAIERAAVIVRVADRYSGDELDAALKAARRAVALSLREIRAGVGAGRSLIEAIDAARSIARNRA